MMDTPFMTARLRANYELLIILYKQGKFEDEVPTTVDATDSTKFYDTSGELPSVEQKFAPAAEDAELRGSKRHPRDLQWAVSSLRNLAQFLFEQWRDGAELSAGDAKSVIPYYYRVLSLSYEVDDYFLSVSDDTSQLLTDLAEEITRDIAAFAERFGAHFRPGTGEYTELLKQILIVALCGVNELYRRHSYEDGLKLARRVKSLLALPADFTKWPIRWWGLRGLCGYVTGKILTAKGDFAEAEQEFLNSVEAYSESIWQKERSFFRYREEMRALEVGCGGGEISPEEYDRHAREFAARVQEHELSRQVALRRSGLASSFGFGFQALVMGRVKDALRLSSLARGIVNWNTGKIYSSYVDLIYYSAKRAENSSSRRSLLHTLRNLSRCYWVFQDLIPSAHYKHRALFQISLVYHYLARWHKEKALELRGTLPPSEEAEAEAGRQFRKARYFWERAAEHLLQTIEDEKLRAHKRLRSESMAVLGHAWSNLGLLEREFGRDGSLMLRRAEQVVAGAWDEADKHPQIRCEVGLARAAVGKARVEYLLDASAPHVPGRYLDETKEVYPSPGDPRARAEIRDILSKSREVLHEVIHLNNNNSIRVLATSYLRLAELALLQRETWPQSREHYEDYMKIAPQVEHDFCHRWALDLEQKILTLSNSFTITITPGATFDKQQFERDLEKYYTDYAVIYAARRIEEDTAARNINERSSLSSYLTAALHTNFGITSKTASNWIVEYTMFEHLRRICHAARSLPPKAPQGKEQKGKRGDA